MKYKVNLQRSVETLMFHLDVQKSQEFVMYKQPNHKKLPEHNRTSDITASH